MRILNLVLAVGVHGATILKNPASIAKRLNYHREICDQRVGVSGDGIHNRNK